MLYLSTDMHHIQRKILEIAQKENVADIGPRELMRRVGARNPQTPKYHLNKLIEAGLLKTNISRSKISPVTPEMGRKKLLLTIPIVGAADAGPATQIAEENVEGYLQLSRNAVDSKNNKLFAIRVVGDSMNRADCYGNTIEDGDYIVVDPERNTIKEINDHYVVSVIDGVANVKKFSFEKDKKQIRLISESTKDFRPILIHASDEDVYTIAGKVVGVVKS